MVSPSPYAFYKYSLWIDFWLRMGFLQTGQAFFTRIAAWRQVKQNTCLCSSSSSGGGGEEEGGTVSSGHGRRRHRGRSGGLTRRAWRWAASSCLCIFCTPSHSWSRLEASFSVAAPL
mmetsp:Transcript_1864/g.5078  ORF Transcript_1864/g.5078 Transcript_1864/m.5078 type:complete len:117 (-) Transcript_1864:330-680(-)